MISERDSADEHSFSTGAPPRPEPRAVSPDESGIFKQQTDAVVSIILSRRLQRSLAALSGAGVFSSIVFVFAIVPNEAIMGPVQRVFYFHVGAAVAAYVLLGVLLFSSTFYLTHRRREWDELADACASSAFLFCTIVLATGMIWAHSAWNTWWRWEPRLVSFLMLWLILGAYRILRWFSAGHDRERVYASVMGIISAVNVPIVVFSIRVLSERDQLHPQVVARGGLRDLPHAQTTLALCICSLICFALFTAILDFHQRNLARRLDEAERLPPV